MLKRPKCQKRQKYLFESKFLLLGFVNPKIKNSSNSQFSDRYFQYYAIILEWSSLTFKFQVIGIVDQAKECILKLKIQIKVQNLLSSEKFTHFPQTQYPLCQIVTMPIISFFLYSKGSIENNQQRYIVGIQKILVSLILMTR